MDAYVFFAFPGEQNVVNYIIYHYLLITLKVITATSTSKNIKLHRQYESNTFGKFDTKNNIKTSTDAKHTCDSADDDTYSLHQNHAETRVPHVGHTVQRLQYPAQSHI